MIVDELRDLLGEIDVDDPVHFWLRRYLDDLESRVNGMTLIDLIEM